MSNYVWKANRIIKTFFIKKKKGSHQHPVSEKREERGK